MFITLMNVFIVILYLIFF